MLNNFTIAAVKQKLITADESEAWRKGIETLIQRGEYFFCVNRFLFVAIK